MLSRMLLIGLALGTAAHAQLRDRSPYPRVHDPSTIVEEGGDAWCFSTGMGVSLLKRDEDGRWRRAGSVFERGATPEWHRKEVPENRGHLWAPDVIRVGERWWVYYSVSSFGKNHSAIGLASTESLEKPDWKDEGLVIRSRRGDRFNAIDPAVIRDGERLWMSFGSFWDGIMLVELDPETGLLKEPDARPRQLANYPEIEAPFIHKEGEWYYLFVNWGKCCRGVNSTYEIRVGRSKDIEGPYVDRNGDALRQGAGTPVLATEGRYIGPGHASIFAKNGKQWLVHHFYDRERRGRSELRMVELRWKDGWPVVEAGP